MQNVASATGAVTSAKIKNGTIAVIDLRPALRRALGVTASGAPEADGAAGAQCPAGQDTSFRGLRLGPTPLRLGPPCGFAPQAFEKIQHPSPPPQPPCSSLSPPARGAGPWGRRGR